jgi:Tfp pilus assembly ATPase PilU
MNKMSKTNRINGEATLGQDLFQVSKQVVVCECEAVASRDKANEVEPHPNRTEIKINRKDKRYYV